MIEQKLEKKIVGTEVTMIKGMSGIMPDILRFKDVENVQLGIQNVYQIEIDHNDGWSSRIEWLKERAEQTVLVYAVFGYWNLGERVAERKIVVIREGRKTTTHEKLPYRDIIKL